MSDKYKVIKSSRDFDLQVNHESMEPMENQRMAIHDKQGQVQIGQRC